MSADYSDCDEIVLVPEIDNTDDGEQDAENWRDAYGDNVPDYVDNVRGCARGELIPSKSEWATTLSPWVEPRFSFETHDSSSGQSGSERANQIKNDREAMLRATEWYLMH